MKNIGPFVAGAIGGIAPNLVRLIVNYSSPAPLPLLANPLSYWMSMAGFALLGGVVVWIFQETNLKQALLIGVGLPSLFQVGNLQAIPTSTGVPSKAPPPAASVSSFSLISSAYAQEAPPAASAPVSGRKLDFAVNQDLPVTVAFYDRNNSLTGTANVKKTGVVPVGDVAVKFALQVGSSTSGSYPLEESPNSTTKVEVTIKEKGSSGFLQGVGLAKGPQYEVTARLSK